MEETNSRIQGNELIQRLEIKCAYASYISKGLKDLETSELFQN